VSSRRCSGCGIDWPDAWTEYRKCPQCGVPTDRLSNVTPLDADAALSMKRHFEFDQFFKDWDEKRVLREAEIVGTLDLQLQPQGEKR
jgi:hypothetical protein